MQSLFSLKRKSTQLLIVSAGVLLMAQYASAQTQSNKQEGLEQKTNTTEIKTTGNMQDASGPKDIAYNGEGPKKCNHCKYTKRPMFGSVYMLGGIGFYDMDALNGRLSTYDYSEWDKPAIPLGVGFTMRFGRLVGGVDWNWLLSSSFESSNDNTRLDMKAWYWQITYGYDVVQWKGLSVYPLIGLGAGHMDIWISQETGASFNDVLQDPGQGVHMSQNSFLISASLGVDYRIKIKETHRKTSFFTVGLRGGYLFQPYVGAWKTHSAEIHSGPERSLQGPVVQLMLGFSGKRHHHKKGYQQNK